MTLKAWLRGWPYRGRNWQPAQDPQDPLGPGVVDRIGSDPDGVSAYVVPDAIREHTRTWAWDLEDYAVQSVSGGSIWFRPRIRLEGGR